MDVLVLNASYEPLKVIDFRRAVVLILFDKAESIESSNTPIRSPSVSLYAPTVIRLKKYVKVPYMTSKAPTKAAILSRDRYSCVYCGKKADSIDHVYPRSLGGEHTWENLAASCKPCNQKKSDKTLKEMGWTMLEKPYRPTKKQIQSFMFKNNPDWIRYIEDSDSLSALSL